MINNDQPPRVSLPDPDTTHYAQWAGDRIKYHSPDQIVEYANARVKAALEVERKTMAARYRDESWWAGWNAHAKEQTEREAGAFDLEESAERVFHAMGRDHQVEWVDCTSAQKEFYRCIAKAAGKANP